VAATEKLPEEPEHSVWSAGCEVIAGAVFTVNATRVEVTDGLHVPLITTSNPLAAATASATAVPVIVKVAVVAPP
jgi:hypothetical protein